MWYDARDLSNGLERVPIAVCVASMGFHALEEFTYYPHSRLSIGASKNLGKVKKDFLAPCQCGDKSCHGHACCCGVKNLMRLAYDKRGRLLSSIINHVSS